MMVGKSTVRPWLFLSAMAISVLISGACMKYLIHFQSEDSCSYEMIDISVPKIMLTFEPKMNM